MTLEEKFRFDLQGFLVVKNVLSADEVAALNKLADEAWPEEPDSGDKRRTSKVSQWGPETEALFDHPNSLPYMIELLGPKFRADHDYSMFMKKGASGGRLHGGPTMQGGVPGDHWYKHRDGVMRNGLTVFTYNLAPARKGDGGFACIPGSHKSNFIEDIPKEVRAFEQPAHYVCQPEVEAGDMVIFTEALIHGTMPWNGDQERRGLLYKFSPGHSAWQQSFYNVDDYPNLTDQQQRILEPPSVGGRKDVVMADA